jgi:hypothetical protein
MEKKTYSIYKNANGKYVVTSTTECPMLNAPPYVYSSELLTTSFLWLAKLKMKSLIRIYETCLNEKIYTELLEEYECKPMRDK